MIKNASQITKTWWKSVHYFPIDFWSLASWDVVLRCGLPMPMYIVLNVAVYPEAKNLFICNAPALMKSGHDASIRTPGIAPSSLVVRRSSLPRRMQARLTKWAKFLHRGHFLAWHKCNRRRKRTSRRGREHKSLSRGAPTWVARSTRMEFMRGQLPRPIKRTAAMS